MRIAYFDCFAGASGDMILGALVDAGLDPDALRASIAAVPLPGWRLEVKRTNKHGLAATAVEVVSEGEQHSRTLADVEALLTNSTLLESDRAAAQRIFRRLAEA